MGRRTAIVGVLVALLAAVVPAAVGAAEAQATALDQLQLTTPAHVGVTVDVATVLRDDATDDPVSGATVRFEVTNPSGTTTFTDEVETDADGLAATSFVPAVRGAHEVEATFAGDEALGASSSGTESLAVYQKVQLTYDGATTGVAGGEVPLSVTLRTVPGGDPIAGQGIDVVELGGSVDAFTDATGRATVSFIPPSAGPRHFHVEFENADGFFANRLGELAAEVTTATVTVALATTAFERVEVGGPWYVGDTAVVATRLNRVSPPAGPLRAVDVQWGLTGPSGPLSQQKSTDLGGVVTFLPSLTARGEHSVEAQFRGDFALAPTSRAADLAVFERAQLTYDGSTTGRAGVPVPLAATLTSVVGGGPIPGQTVTFTVMGPGGPVELTGTTDSAGRATADLVPGATGPYEVVASFVNAADFFVNRNGDLAAEVAPTVVVTIDAATQPTALAYAGATVGRPLEPLALAAALRTSSGPLAGKRITFTVTGPGGVTVRLLATTNATGRATATYLPLLVGNLTIAVSFAGDTELDPSGTTVQVPVRALTTLTYPGETTGRPSRAVSLSASLRAGVLGVPFLPVPRQDVVFTVTRPGGGTVQLTGTTDALGRAGVSYVPPVVGTYTVVVSFRNDAAFLDPATTTATLTIRR